VHIHLLKPLKPSPVNTNDHPTSLEPSNFDHGAFLHLPLHSLICNASSVSQNISWAMLILEADNQGKKESA
jgi:hypothetical protein